MQIPQYQCVLGEKWQSSAKVSGVTTTCKITSFLSYLNWCRIQLCGLVGFFENNSTRAGIVTVICTCQRDHDLVCNRFFFERQPLITCVKSKPILNSNTSGWIYEIYTHPLPATCWSTNPFLKVWQGY